MEIRSLSRNAFSPELQVHPDVLQVVVTSGFFTGHWFKGYLPSRRRFPPVVCEPSMLIGILETSRVESRTDSLKIQQAKECRPQHTEIGKTLQEQLT